MVLRSANRGVLGAIWGLVGPALRAQEAKKVSTATPRRSKGLPWVADYARFCENMKN